MSIYLDIRDCSSIFADDDDDTPAKIVIEGVFTEEVEPFLSESYELEANTNPIRMIQSVYFVSMSLHMIILRWLFAICLILHMKNSSSKTSSLDGICKKKIMMLN